MCSHPAVLPVLDHRGDFPLDVDRQVSSDLSCRSHTTPDLYLLARILGHSYQRVTELYAHLLPDHLARAAKAVSLPSPVSPAVWQASKAWGTPAGIVDGKQAKTVRKTVRKTASAS
jgi:hypothetical protein